MASAERINAVKKQFNASRAEKKLDRLFAEAVKARDGYRSRRSGKTNNLQCCHIHSRSKKSVRWDLQNAVTLTAGEHLFWAHKHPAEFIQWIQSWMPAAEYDLLMVKASKPTSPLNPFKAELIEQELKQVIASCKPI